MRHYWYYTIRYDLIQYDTIWFHIIRYDFIHMSSTPFCILFAKTQKDGDFWMTSWQDWRCFLCFWGVMLAEAGWLLLFGYLLGPLFWCAKWQEMSSQKRPWMHIRHHKTRKKGSQCENISRYDGWQLLSIDISKFGVHRAVLCCEIFFSREVVL